MTDPTKEKDKREHPDCILCQDDNYRPPHDGTPECLSGAIAAGGTRSHCTCDYCF